MRKICKQSLGSRSRKRLKMQEGRYAVAYLPNKPGVDAPAKLGLAAGMTEVHSVKLFMLLTPSMLSLI